MVKQSLSKISLRKKSFKHVLIACSSCLLLIGLPLDAKKLQLYTVLYAPFTIVDKQGFLSGFAVEVVKSMQARLPPDEAREHIIVLPQERARLTLSKKKNAAVFSLYPPDMTPTAHWVGPLAMTDIQLWGLKGSALETEVLEFQAPVEWHKVRLVGVSNGGYALKLVENLGMVNSTTVKLLSQDQGTAALIRMLLTHRIDAFAGSSAHVRAISLGLGLDSTDVFVAKNLGVGQLYIGFNAKIPTEQVQRWRFAFEAIVADGTFDNIYRKYAAFQFKTLNHSAKP